MKNTFETSLKSWLTENGYIGENWRFDIKSRDIIGNTDLANIYCESFKPRKRKPFFIEFKYNFTREQILTDTVNVYI